MVIAIKLGERFQSEKFRTALKEVDYTIRDIRIKATGDVLVRSGKKSNKVSDLEFKVLNQVFPILLNMGETKDQKEQQIKRVKLITKLREAIKAGKQELTIVGQILEVEGNGEGILLEHVSGF